VKIAVKTHFTVVRNAAYRAGDFKTRSRHNERENDVYQNGDVILERSNLNVHYRQNFNSDGSVESYSQTFERLLAEGKIVKRGLKEDAKVFDELVFDVNSDYFEQGDGYESAYEFAKKFYAETYKLAVKEIGGEDYILSAVLHADERNTEASARLKKDVFHYHLHVVYVPVVEKKILWSKRCKDKSLVGTVKEIIPQISHSKKWPRIKAKNEEGKISYVNSYSLLQDHYYEHMKAAGFDGFSRGVRGSTAEHLEVLEYKTQQEEKRLKKVEEKLDEKREIHTNARATIKEIEGIGRQSLLGGYSLTTDEFKRLVELAKKSVDYDKMTDRYKRKLAEKEKHIKYLCKRIEDLQRGSGIVPNQNEVYRRNYDELYAEVKPFLESIRNCPELLLEFIQNQQKYKAKESER
jgi:flagellar biosynthesis chaperone FliJ